MADRFERGRGNSFSYERFNLPEIFVRADLEFFRRPPLFDLRPRSFRLVKSMQPRNHTIDFRFANQTFREQLAQEPAAWQFSHLHAVLANCLLRHSGCGGWISFRVERKTGSGFVDWNNT